MSFYVGQKVVCVDPFSCLKKGQAYTCQVIGIDGKMMGVDCCSQHSNDGKDHWFCHRFRPKNDMSIKNDISVFTEMLKNKEMAQD